jgi:hypothetical protein
MNVWVLRCNGKPYTLRTLDDLTAVVSVLRLTLPKARLTAKRVRLPDF